MVQRITSGHIPADAYSALRLADIIAQNGPAAYRKDKQRDRRGYHQQDMDPDVTDIMAAHPSGWTALVSGTPWSAGSSVMPSFLPHKITV
jgi:hypothetical protein